MEKGKKFGDSYGGPTTTQDDFDDHIPLANRLQIIVSPNVDDGMKQNMRNETTIVKSPSLMVKKLKMKARKPTYKAIQNLDPISGLQKV